jgi:hypothetical protein
LSDDIVLRWETLARKLTATFEVTDPQRRRRWAQAGTKLSANLVLEHVTAGARAGVVALPWEETLNPVKVLEVLLAGDGLSLLLSLLPERDRRFKRRRFGPIDVIDVDIRALVLDWISGVDLSDLATRYLSEVAGEDADAFKFEQLASFLAKVCEHHLPWTTSIVIDWIHQETGVELCPSLPAHLHYGTPSRVGLGLMLGGIRSRRLGVAIGRRAGDEDIPEENVRPWLAQMGLAAWRSEFDAAPAELADLLQYVRNPAADIGQPLLDGAAVHVPCVFNDLLLTTDELPVGYLLTAEAPSPLVTTNSAGEVIGQLDPSVHHDVSMLIDAGFQMFGTAVDVNGARLLSLRLDVD